MELPENLKQDITLYCQVNNISDIDSFIIKMLTQAFTIEKYGEQPNIKSITDVKTIIQDSKPVVEENKEIIIVNSENKKDIYGE